MKYIIKASTGVLLNLKNFLEDIKSKALLFVLHFYFYFKDEEDFPVSVEDEDSECDYAEKVSQIIDTEAISPSSICSILTSYKLPYFCSADFNDEESEICIASHSTAGLESRKSSNLYLESLVDRKRSVKEIMLSGVSAVKYLPGKSNVVLASYGKKVKLINTETGRDIFKYDAEHRNRIWSIDTNPLNPFFATASSDSTVCIWNLNEQIAVKQYSGHSEDVTIVKFHPNGLYFATGSTDTSILLWGIDKSLPVRCFNGHRGKITSLAFSDDGKMLASSDNLGIVKIWDIRECTAKFEVPDRKALGCNFCFNDVNTRISYFDKMGYLRIWDYRYGTEIDNEDFSELSPLVMKFNKRRQWKIAFKKTSLNS